jgi:hypothetical protein
MLVEAGLARMAKDDIALAGSLVSAAWIGYALLKAPFPRMRRNLVLGGVVDHADFDRPSAQRRSKRPSGRSRGCNSSFRRSDRRPSFLRSQTCPPLFPHEGVLRKQDQKPVADCVFGIASATVTKSCKPLFSTCNAPTHASRGSERPRVRPARDLDRAAARAINGGVASNMEAHHAVLLLISDTGVNSTRAVMSGSAIRLIKQVDRLFGLDVARLANGGQRRRPSLPAGMSSWPMTRIGGCPVGATIGRISRSTTPQAM